jgi:hypothetical protein
MSSCNSVQNFGPALTNVIATFAVGASGAVPAASTWRGSNKGAITVTRSAAGQYTVVWDQRFKGLLVHVNAMVRVGVTSGNPTITQGVAVGLPDRAQTGATARTVKFSTLTSGAVADLAAGSEITIFLSFQETSV